MTPLTAETTSPSVSTSRVRYSGGQRSSSLYGQTPPQIVIVAAGVPPWLPDVERRINEILSLERGWDTYGADSILLDHVIEALRLLTALVAVDSPAPAIVPTAARGIQFEWDTSEGAVEVRVGDDGAHLFVGSEDSELEGVPTPELLAHAAAALKSAVLAA